MTIDLRSDTVTRPTPAMREAMAAAEVGDDVYGEDPTVNRLEATCAERAGMESGLFVSSGTQGNLVAILAHCGRGDEYITGIDNHTFKYEAGGASVLGGVQPYPLAVGDDGTLDLDAVERAIKPDDFHYPVTRLICLENTHSGRVLSLDYQASAAALARRRGLALHLDGARAFNAAVALGVELADVTRGFDSVSLCFSKGLGTPAGSVLCGDRGFIERARRLRKMVGGGMRQAGVLAAACLHALEHHVVRLEQDHAQARDLAAGLASIDPVQVDPDWVQTNMVYVAVAQEHAESLHAWLAAHGILVNAGNPLRFVTHLDIADDDVARTVGAIEAYFSDADANRARLAGNADSGRAAGGYGSRG